MVARHPTRHHHWRRVGPHAAAGEQGNEETNKSAPFLSLADDDFQATCNTQTNAHKQTDKDQNLNF